MSAVKDRELGLPSRQRNDLLDERRSITRNSARAVGRMSLVSICCFLTVAIFFRYQIGNGFTTLFTDRFDGMIEIAIQEHWYNVLRGLAVWSQTNFFYPVRDALGYQDGYLANGAIYAVFRALGFDPFLSSEMVNMAMRAIGFAGAYLACRRVLGLELGWALLGSVLFTLSNSSFVHTGHIQLLSISFAPLMAVLLHGSLGALGSGRRRALLAWGLAATLLYAAWLMTGYYMAWYFLYFSAVALVILLVLLRRDEQLALLAAVRQQAFSLLTLALITVLVNLPFLSVYRPKAAESGQHPYTGAFSMTPSFLDIPNVGASNLLYGRLVVGLHDMIAPTLPLFSERTTGIPAILLFLFGCSVIWLWRHRAQAKSLPLAKAMAAAVLLTWVTAIHVRSFSLWYCIYHLVPGAKAMRAVGRYQIFLAAPVIALAVQYLSWNARRIVTPVLILVSVLLVVEQLNVGPQLQLDRPHELARLQSVPPPPSVCKAFFVSAARPERLGDPGVDDNYSHNVDAMMIAEYLDLPTINGLGAFVPPGWQLYAPDKPSYMPAVTAFATSHGVTGLCGLDLRTMHWDTAPQIAPVRQGMQRTGRLLPLGVSEDMTLLSSHLLPAALSWNAVPGGNAKRVE